MMENAAERAALSAQRVEAARAAVARLGSHRQQLAQRERDLAQAADRKRAEIDKAQAPRREKRGILANILRRGGPPQNEESMRLALIDGQIAAAQARAEGVTDELQVIADLQTELQQESAELARQMEPLQRELDEARFEAARIEVENQMLPAFIEAAEHFRRAYAKLMGAGKAHCEMRERLKQRYGEDLGGSIGSIGSPRPVADVHLVLLGFGIESRLRGHPTLRGTNYTAMILPAAETIANDAATTLERWEA